MSLQIQYSRISHHALSGVGLTFSIPPGVDFTIINGSASWNGSGTDLADREIGVNTSDNKAYLRIGNNINQLSFVGSTSSSPNLAQTLSIGNNSETYKICTGTGTYIYSSNGGGQLELDNLGMSNRVLLSNDNGGVGNEFILLDGTSPALSMGSYGGSIEITDGNNGIYIKQLSGTISTPANAASPGIFINAKNAIMGQYATNSVVIGGEDIVATEPNTVYTSKLNITGDASPYVWKHNVITSSQSSAGTYYPYTISMNDDEVITIKMIVNAYSASLNTQLSDSVMGSFIKYGGTIQQVGVIYNTTNENFGDGTAASFDTNGSVVRIAITNGGTLTRWVIAYEYIISGT